MISKLLSLPVLLMILPAALAAADSRGREPTTKTVFGARNAELSEGARELLAGDIDEGIRLTRLGLEAALGTRERVAGLSNLCAGYLRKQEYEAALDYCDEALVLDPGNWRARTNRALLYLLLEDFERARTDLEIAEDIAPHASSPKKVRAMYLDATDPVVPTVTIDDRRDPDDGG